MAIHKKISAKRETALPVMYKTVAFKLDEKSMSVTGRTVTGYLAAFKNLDGDHDVLMPGCFLKSIAERGVNHTGGNSIAHLWQHKMDTPLGKYTVLKEDDYGLYFECVYDDIQKANDALVQFKSGTLTNFSIGYSYIWDKMEYMDYCEKDNCIVMPGGACPVCGDKSSLSYCFVIKELELYEGSVVTLACNENALFTGLKSEQVEDEINILTEEAEELLSTLKARKRYELGQIFSKLKSLAKFEPILESKESLRLEAEKKAKEAKNAEDAKLAAGQADKTKKRKFAGLATLAN